MRSSASHGFAGGSSSNAKSARVSSFAGSGNSCCATVRCRSWTVRTQQLGLVGRPIGPDQQRAVGIEVSQAFLTGEGQEPGRLDLATRLETPLGTEHREPGVATSRPAHLVNQLGIGVGDDLGASGEVDRVFEHVEAVEEMFWRALFISALLGEAKVTAPAEDLAECHERQQQARTQLHQVAAGLPEEVLTRYRESMAENLLGRAFAALVAVRHNTVRPSSTGTG